MTADDKGDELDAWLERDPTPWWQPQEDDPPKLKGTVTGVDFRPNKNGEQCPFVTVWTDDGKYWEVRGYHQVLWDELARRQPEVGDRIGIKYLGRPDKAFLYEVRVIKANPEPLDWTALEKAPEAEQSHAQTGLDEEPY